MLLLFRTLVLCLCLLHTRDVFASSAEPFLLIEYFTAESCGEAEESDRFIEALQARYKDKNNTFILSCSLDYLGVEKQEEIKNHEEGELLLARSDFTLNEYCDERQGYYFDTLDTGTLSTPQVIMNGEFVTSGKNQEIVSSGIEMVLKHKFSLSVPIRKHGDVVEITLPEIDVGYASDIWLVGYISGDEGQNEVVSYNGLIDAWDGKYKVLPIKLSEEAQQADHFLVTIHKEGTGEIIAQGHI